MQLKTVSAYNSESEAISLYIHIPFCHKKCPYCDFNTYAGMFGWRKRYIAALIREITLLGQALQSANGAPKRVCTIFWGGGTPSLLPATDICDVLHAVRAVFAVDDSAEITLEANPGALEYNRLDAAQKCGVNRLSMGAQSFDADLLHWLGRIHSPDDILTAAAKGNAAGFRSLNFDFMYALPEQTMAQWQDTLEKALALQAQHLSLYSLIVEPNTPLFDWVQRGDVVTASEDIAADMYEYACDRLAAAGYHHYEISNWALPGYECEHNITYWKLRPFIGVGAGAHSFWNNTHYSNQTEIAAYIAATHSEWNPAALGIGSIGGPVVERRELMAEELISETVIMRLRLREGIPLGWFQNRFQRALADVFPELRFLQDNGLLEEDNNDGESIIRLTQRGMLLGNEVFERFLSLQKN